MNKPRPIEPLILTLRGQRVILDADLAELYGVQTKVLNQAVKRNSERFPEDFVFRLTEDEKAEVVANCDHLRPLIKSPQQGPGCFAHFGVRRQPAGDAAFASAPLCRKSGVALRFPPHSKRLHSKAAPPQLSADEFLRSQSATLKPGRLLLTPPPDPHKRKTGFDFKGDGE